MVIFITEISMGKQRKLLLKKVSGKFIPQMAFLVALRFIVLGMWVHIVRWDRDRDAFSPVLAGDSPHVRDRSYLSLDGPTDLHPVPKFASQKCANLGPLRPKEKFAPPRDVLQNSRGRRSSAHKNLQPNAGKEGATYAITFLDASLLYSR